MRIMGLLAVALMTTAVGAQTRPAISPAIGRALADPARADQAADDSRRQASAVLAFSGVKPGDQVIDFIPGGNYYWTRIFAGIVGPKGHVLAAWPATSADRVRPTFAKFEGWKLPSASVEAVDLATYAPAKPVDLVWTVQNYHDLLNRPGGEAAAAAVNKAAFRLLRKGGTYIVIDHADAPGSGVSGTDTKHRIDPAAVKAEVTAAGFVFAGQSDVLRNPADDHSRTVFDPSIRGHTDQFVFKFRKP